MSQIGGSSLDNITSDEPDLRLADCNVTLGEPDRAASRLETATNEPPILA
jgi:hypothetical protein